MSGGIHEQWSPKTALSVSPSHSKVSYAKGRSSGWAAFDLKQRLGQSIESVPDIDPYPAIPSTVTSMPRIKKSEISNRPLRSFSSVVQPSREYPDLVGNGNCLKGRKIVGDSSTDNGNKTVANTELNPSAKKLKEHHCWADNDLIQDVLGAVNNDFDMAFNLLKSMVSSGCSEETNENNYVEVRSLSQDSSIDNKNVLADEGVTSDSVKHIVNPSPTNMLNEHILNRRTETADLRVPFESKRPDNISYVQVDSQHIIAVPVEPEWEEDDVYLSHRKDAIRAIRSASQHSRAAGNAFMGGDHISAQKLSQKAQEYWIAAEKLNAKAAEEILSIRNSGNGLWKLDLHGLHASEAVHALQNHLWKIETNTFLPRPVSSNRLDEPKTDLVSARRKSANCLSMLATMDKEQGTSWQRPTALQVVTGTGNHSRGQASLPTAVRSFLVENGYRFDERRPGVIDVRPKFRHKQTGQNAQASINYQ